MVFETARIAGTSVKDEAHCDARERLNDPRHWRDLEVEITEQVRCAEAAGNV
jgi:hypothetical protein